MDFAALPPEVNSGLMYTGPGAAPMLAAAASWDSLAVEMHSAARDYETVIADLTDGPWRGAAALSMARATTPYVAWMSATATQAEQAANQAKAAAGAYETAFAATVPPPVIVANRASLASLVATNLLGQNTPAIAATESQYAEMWAQDAGAMYGYAGSSSAASTLTPFAEPSTTTDTAPAADVQSSSPLSQLVTAIPGAMQQLAAPTSSQQASGLNGVLDWLGLGGTNLSTPAGILSFLAGTDGSPLGAFLNDNGLNTLFSSGFYMPGNFLGTMTDFVGMGSAGAASEAAGGAAAGAAAAGEVGGALAAPVAGAGALGSAGSAASAAVGQGTAIGALAVPPSWGSAPSVLMTPLTPTPPLGDIPLSTPPQAVAGLPGMPAASAAANQVAAAPKYGFRPIVMAHSPLAG